MLAGLELAAACAEDDDNTLDVEARGRAIKGRAAVAGIEARDGRTALANDCEGSMECQRSLERGRRRMSI